MLLPVTIELTNNGLLANPDNHYVKARHPKIMVVVVVVVVKGEE